MAFFKEPNFQDRANASAKARTEALAKLKAKPALDPEEKAQRDAARAAKQAAEAEKRLAAKAAREEAKAAKLREAEERRAQQEANKKPELTEEERKAIRDAKYAARKARKR